MDKIKILNFIWQASVKHPRDTVEGVMNVVQREAIINTNTGHSKDVMWARSLLRWIDDDCERFYIACKYVLSKLKKPVNGKCEQSASRQ
jgi:hypothetical protein